MIRNNAEIQVPDIASLWVGEDGVAMKVADTSLLAVWVMRLGERCHIELVAFWDGVMHIDEWLAINGFMEDSEAESKMFEDKQYSMKQPVHYVLGV